MVGLAISMSELKIDHFVILYANFDCKTRSTIVFSLDCLFRLIQLAERSSLGFLWLRFALPYFQLSRVWFQILWEPSSADSGPVLSGDCFLDFRTTWIFWSSRLWKFWLDRVQRRYQGIFDRTPVLFPRALIRIFARPSALNGPKWHFNSRWWELGPTTTWSDLWFDFRKS